MADGQSSDSDLLRRAASGDPAAWESLYLRHRDFVHAVAVRFLHDATEAQDVVQDVFVAVFQAAGRWRDEAGFRTWLWRTTANRCLNRRRASGRAVLVGGTAAPDDAIPTTPDPAVLDPAALVIGMQRQDRLREAFLRLPDRQRMALILVCLEGLRYDQAADALECSVAALESLLVRARRTLGLAIEEP